MAKPEDIQAATARAQAFADSPHGKFIYAAGRLQMGSSWALGTELMRLADLFYPHGLKRTGDVLNLRNVAQALKLLNPQDNADAKDARLALIELLEDQ